MRECFALPVELKERLAARIYTTENKKDLFSQVVQEVEGFLLEVRERKGLFYEFLRDLGYQGYVKGKEENNYQV